MLQHVSIAVNRGVSFCTGGWGGVGVGGTRPKNDGYVRPKIQEKYFSSKNSVKKTPYRSKN